MRALGLEWAPLDVPLQRRLESFGILQFIISFLFLGVGCIVISLYVLLFTKYYWIILLYAAWYVYDYKTPEKGGRRVSFFRKMICWKYYRDYFPIKLVKTSELDPSKNYIVGYHPHGVMAIGAFLNFATDATNFCELFPGMKPVLLVLRGQFNFPFFREYFMTTGSCSCSGKSMEWHLTKEGCGNVLILVPGGARESLECNPDNFNLILKNRRGFIRMAIKHGANLVPSFSFGENRTFVQVKSEKGSFLHAFQHRLTKILGFGVPIFHGRGIFNYTFGLLPYRTSITTILGEPIEVKMNQNPTQEEVDELHSFYVKKLIDLFETHKSEQGILPDVHLNIV
ncbi:DgyrCDS5479 [Dimorphilus gyrociliatus]|uniref:Acyltransferase n=1 Tax=Dimorphilus gyrociliatus TaxID=2664684 RepID=A0A7I8VK06_9ANNE|nr:DgyrCDS5479 [Dimorphilus gyrociliatus]